jgi:hypothetical protein
MVSFDKVSNGLAVPDNEDNAGADPGTRDRDLGEQCAVAGRHLGSRLSQLPKTMWRA